jgi:hypothetical protein
MKKIYDPEQLVLLGQEIDENMSLPCILVAPELLRFSIERESVAIREKTDQSRDVTEFLPNPKREATGEVGIERIHDPGTGKTRYVPLQDGHIPCGVTRVSREEFEAAKNNLERETLGPIEISQFADGDLIRLYAHRTLNGPGVVIHVRTEHLLPEITSPLVALNPFGTNGWQYLSSLFETAAFFWAITDGRHAFLLSSLRHYYPDLVAQVHKRCMTYNQNLKQRSWPQALAEIRLQLKD